MRPICRLDAAEAAGYCATSKNALSVAACRTARPHVAAAVALYKAEMVAEQDLKIAARIGGPRVGLAAVG
jgi:hypothetical protein